MNFLAWAKETIGHLWGIFRAHAKDFRAPEA